MKDRRKIERFNLALPSVIEILDPGPDMKETSFEALTRDVSSLGAFFLTPVPLRVGTRINADMVLMSEKIQQPSGYPQAKATGHVVRTDPTGVAVCFSGRCRFGIFE